MDLTHLVMTDEPATVSLFAGRKDIWLEMRGDVFWRQGDRVS